MQPRRWNSLIPQLPVWSHTLTQGRTGCWLSPHFTKTILQAGVTKRSRTPFLHLTPTYRQKRSPRHSKPKIQVPDDSHPSSLINSRFQMGTVSQRAISVTPTAGHSGKSKPLCSAQTLCSDMEAPPGEEVWFGDEGLHSSAGRSWFYCKQSMENPIPEDIVQSNWDLPGDSVVRTTCFHFRGCRFNPWSRNLGFHKLHGATQNK